MLGRAILLAAVISLAATAQGAGPYEPRHAVTRERLDSLPAMEPHKENTRLVGGVLTVLLGPFGAHRLYLGTTPRVAIVYGITFGGFGVLALIDLAHLVFSKDLEPYRDNGQVFMWNKPDGEVTPP